MKKSAAARPKSSPLMFRQGDVLLVAIAAIPPEAAAHQSQERIVLAYGEVTGHAHAIAVEEAQEFRTKTPVPVFDWQAERFLQVEVKALLKHEEHSTIKIPAGRYAVVRQREYSPAALRMVSD